MRILDVVVLDAAQRSALAAIRSLGKRGIAVAAADSSTVALGSASRYCVEHFTYPDPAHDRAQFIRWLHDLGAARPGIAVLPVTDVSVPATMEAIAQGAAIRAALAPERAYRAAVDKQVCAELARAAGLSAPRTHVVSPGVREEDLRALGLTFPVVLKPRRSAVETPSGVVRRTVTYASDVASLQRGLDEMFATAADDVLLQELIRGTGAGVFALYDRGTPVTFFAHKRLREKPPSGGVSVLSESTSLPPQLRAATEALLTPLGWHGVAMVELKIDREGTAWLMEVNARLWGSVQLAVDCGVDFPYFLFQLARGEPVTAPASYAVGRRLRWELGDLDNLYLSLRDRGLTRRAKAAALARFLIPWQPGMRYELARLSDPAPAWLALRQYVSDLIG